MSYITFGSVVSDDWYNELYNTLPPTGSGRYDAEVVAADW